MLLVIVWRRNLSSFLGGFLIKTKPTAIQREAVSRLLSNRSYIISLKTGQGKTLVALIGIEFYRRKGCNRFIVFAPKRAVKEVWPSEIAKHTDFEYQLISDFNEAKDGIVLVTYSESRKYLPLLRKLAVGSVIILDEVHKLKNPKTQLVQSLMPILFRADVLWGLSATTLLNSVMDLYGMFCIFQPGRFLREMDFKYRFLVVRMRNVGKHKQIPEVVGYKNLDVLKKMIGEFIFSVESDIDVKFHKYFYSLTPAELEEYKKFARGILNGSEKLKVFASRLHDLQRCVDGSIDLDGNYCEKRGSKFYVVESLLKSILSKGESVILVCDYIFTLDLLKSADLGYPIYEKSGRVSQIPDKFPCVLVMTSAAAESLNLKQFNHVVFYSIPFSVGAFVQSVGRISRIDSEHLGDLHVYIPSSDDTIDKYKALMIQYNADVIRRLLGNEANLPSTVNSITKKLLIQLRKELLWKTKTISV